MSVFETACLAHRRNSEKGLARLKEIGFKLIKGPQEERLVLDNMVADMRSDPKGGVRCFAATPVADVKAFVAGMDSLMRQRFAGAVARGALNGAPAWKATPSGEEPFLVAIRAAQRAPDQPVVAIATLIAPKG